jgi:excisionase family DNA binding protein
MNNLVSTKEASLKLNISVRRVQALIESGRLPAKKIGNSFVIKESDLKLVKTRKSGRPSNGGKPEEKDWDALIKKYAGKHNDLPPDLSTNKKYMEGFGSD